MGSSNIIITSYIIFSLGLSGVLSGQLKELTTTISNVTELITGGYVYVDKTGFLPQFLRSPFNHFLLTRPKYFGKTTFVSMIREIFENADKNLFNGTDICRSKYKWETHPVISISFSDGIAVSSPEEFNSSLVNALQKVGESYEIFSVQGGNMTEMVQNLISMLHQKFSKKVVVLVDDYDHPFTEVYEKSQVWEKNLAVMQEFFSAVKSMTADTKLCFVTGVVRIAEAGLDEWTDITQEADYADILGFTQKEIEYYFTGHIDNVVKHRTNTTREDVLNEIKYWYEGNQFTGSKLLVYHPYSIVSYFTVKKAHGFCRKLWLSPKFMGLNEKIARYPNSVITYLHGKKSYPVKRILLNYVDVDEVEGLNPLEELMLQAGYLTIKKYDPKRDSYKIGFTNRETQDAFFFHFLQGFGPKKYDELRENVARIRDDLVNLKVDSFMDKLNTYMATFLANATDEEDRLSRHYPRDFRTSNEIFLVIFRSAMMMAEIETISETAVAGRLDFVKLFIDKTMYLFELKLSIEPVDECIKYYRAKYDGQHVVCFGLKFDTKTARIVDCVAAELSNEGKEVKRVHSDAAQPH